MSLKNSPKGVLLHYIELVNQGRLDELETVVAPDFVPHTGQMPVGIEPLRQTLQNLRAAFPDLTYLVEQLIEQDEKVFSRIVITGTHQRPFNGLPATGKSIAVQSFDFITIKDGKMIDDWMILDVFRMLQQLGAIPERLMLPVSPIQAEARARETHASILSESTTNQALVKQYLAFLEGKGSSIEELFAPTFVEHTDGEVVQNKAQEHLLQEIVSLRQSISNIRFDKVIIVSEQNCAACYRILHGIHRESLSGIPETGKFISVAQADFFRIQENRFVEHWGILDQMSLLQQLGIGPTHQ